jgi:tetratricopeptide (TPR) repeat protein
MKTLNVKFLAILLGITALVALIITTTHYLQAVRIGRALLAQARTAEEQGKAQEATLYLSRYLEFEPADVDARAHLASLLAGRSLAASPQAYARALMVLEQVLGRDPDRRDSRRLLVRIALDTGNLELAGEHLKILCDGSSTADAEASEMRGRYYDARGEYDKAAEWYRRGYQQDSTRVDSAAHLAELLRRHPTEGQAEAQQAEADQLMDDVVARNPAEYRAYLARWHYRATFDDLKKNGKLRSLAGSDVARALELAPQAPEVVVAVAERARVEDDKEGIGSARKTLNDGLDAHPKDAKLYRALAALEMQAGRREAALDCLHKALKELPVDEQGEFVWSLTHLLIEGSPKERDEAAALVQSMRRAAGVSATADYLQARLLLATGQLREAARLLERARQTLSNTPEVADQIDLALGTCYDGLGEPANAGDAYARVSRRGTSSLMALLGRAAAESAQDHFDVAIARYREAAALPGAPAEIPTTIVHLLISRNLKNKSGDWSAVEGALRDLEKAKPGSAEVALLRAESQFVQGKPDDARRTLEEACAKDPDYKQQRLRLALAGVVLAGGDAVKARALLDEAGVRGGDTPELCAARAGFWMTQPREQALTELARLAVNIERFSKPEERSLVLRSLAEANARHGSYKEAELLCAQLAAVPGNANDLGLRLLLCELAVQTKNEKLLRQTLDELRRIEDGEGPAWCYGESLRLTALAQDGKLEGLPEARRLLESATAKRPGWPVLALAKAEVAELQNRPEEAIDAYKQALEGGERGPRVRRKLIELLYRQQRYREADDQLRQLRAQTPDTPGLRLLAADLSIRTRDSTRDIKDALQSITTETKDYRDALWLGQILAASPQHAIVAEKHLRRAVELEPTAPETWVALVQFLAVRGRIKDAEAEVKQAATQLPREKRALALAPCYEVLNRFDQALEQYEIAARTGPDDLATLRASAGFYLRALRPQLAEPLLRRIIERKGSSASDVAWARQALAVVLATRGDYKSFLEALSLVGLKMEDGRLSEDNAAGENSIERRRAKAHVLATRPFRTFRDRAIKLLEDLDASEGLAAGDRYLLAQLYEGANAWPRAGEQLRRLVETQEREPTYLAHYVQNLLHREKPLDARPVLERLEALEKERNLAAGTLGSVELRARLLEASGDGEQAVTLLNAHAARSGARPEEVLLPIISLTRQKRYEQALALFEQAWQAGKCPPDLLASPYVALLREARFSGEPCERADLRLRVAVEKVGKSSRAQTALLFARADLADLRGRFDEAETYYRQILTVEKNDPLALNNLAWLLAVRSRKGDEALRYIQSAIETLGPRPDLLDTRALVYLALEQYDKARADLTTALVEAPSATRYLHLARVCQLAEDASGTEAALREAKTLGLKRAQLHPAEQVACGKLLDGID